jgi:hypothetical protein
LQHGSTAERQGRSIDAQGSVVHDGQFAFPREDRPMTADVVSPGTGS